MVWVGGGGIGEGVVSFLIVETRPRAYKEMLSMISGSAQNRTQRLEFCSREF